MSSLVLTYHAHNIAGVEYGLNDHVALANDLEILRELDAEVVPLTQIVDDVRDPARKVDRSRLRVGISFDDGPLFDFEDFVHPKWGAQRSFLNILRDFRARHGASVMPRLHATSFVIASPEARKAMERAPSCGYEWIDGWLSDGWWADAEASGLMGIGNHSWDHVHPEVAGGALSHAARGDFALVDNFDDAERQIRAAEDFINARLGRTCELFAYPYGHVNEYLRDDYLPRRGASLGLKGAFGTGGVIDATSSVWSIPRVVCGHHWRTPGEFRRLVAP